MFRTMSINFSARQERLPPRLPASLRRSTPTGRRRACGEPSPRRLESRSSLDMKQSHILARPAVAALFAAAVLSTAPVFAQDTAAPPPVINAPPPVISPAPAPAPAPAATPAPVAAAPAPAPTVTRAAPAPAARPAARVARAASARAPAPRARAVTPAPAAAPAPAAPVPVSVEPAALPAGVTPALTPGGADIPQVGAASRSETGGRLGILPWLIAGALLIAGAAMLFARRRRDEVYEQDAYEDEQAAYEEPAIVPVPTDAFAPVAPVAVGAILADEDVSAAEPDREDVAALAADSAPEADRPWLEFLMRPVRAGTNEEDAVVEFELTVGNTGSRAARDVRISTWMVAAGAASDMERSLIEPPADAQHSEVSIEPGDGARVDGSIALPKEGLRGPVLPVVVADARYTLPNGGEGRTSASFAVGLPSGEGEGLEPFAVDLPSGLHEDVEARLHGEPQRA
jgi:hypothetical protein